MIIALYLLAIVAANLIVTVFGPQFAILNVFIFIGLDITTRDILHDRWHGRHLWRNMALLILSGSALSVLVNINALPIALASSTAFFVATIVDALIYQVLRERAFLLRVNGSNVPSAVVDTIIFVILAFGAPILWSIMGGVILAKIAGGFFWSLVVSGIKRAISAPE